MKSRFFMALAMYCFASISGVHADQLYVLNWGSNNVSVIDTFSNQQISLIPVGNQPSAIALAPLSRILYVANRTDNTVNVIDARTNQNFFTIPVGSHPVGLFLSPNERYLYVLTEGTTSISVVDTETYKVSTTISLGAEPFYATMAHHGKKLYIIGYACHVVFVVDTTTATLADIITIGPMGTNPTGIAVVSPPTNPADEIIYLTVPDSESISNNGNLIVINAASHKIVRSIPVEPTPGGVIVGPTDKQAFVINGVYSQNIELIDTDTYSIGPIPVGRRSSYGIFSPNGNMLYITNGGSNDVTVINTQNHTVVSTIPTGNWPLRGTIASNGMLYICNGSQGTVSVIDTTNNTVIANIPVGATPCAIVP